MHGDHINIAFNRNDLALLVGNRPRLIEVIEHLTLVENWCFRRVQVFRWHILRQGPPAKGNHPAPAIADRKHHPVAETVIGHGDIITRNDKAGLNHLVEMHPLVGEVAAQGRTVIWRIANAKLSMDGRIEITVREVAPRPRPACCLQFDWKNVAAISITS